ncbi:hypothetical protein BH09DEP1_BH09DEP1_2040 [soil metagenome]
MKYLLILLISVSTTIHSMENPKPKETRIATIGHLTAHTLRCDYDYRWSDLHEAASKGDTESIQKIISSTPLEKRDTIINTRNRKGQTPFWWAMYEGQRKAAQLLLASGASIDAADMRGYTPLHTAVLYGTSGNVTFLLNHNAAANTKLKDNGSTPLHQLADHIDISTAQEISMPSFSPEDWGKIKHHYINAEARKKETDLQLSIQHARDKAIKADLILRKNGLELLKITNSAGQTPVDLSCTKGTLRVLSIFVLHGAPQIQQIVQKMNLSSKNALIRSFFAAWSIHNDPNIPEIFHPNVPPHMRTLITSQEIDEIQQKLEPHFYDLMTDEQLLTAIEHSYKTLSELQIRYLFECFLGIDVKQEYAANPNHPKVIALMQEAEKSINFEKQTL